MELTRDEECFLVAFLGTQLSEFETKREVNLAASIIDKLSEEVEDDEQRKD